MEVMTKDERIATLQRDLAAAHETIDLLESQQEVKGVIRGLREQLEAARRELAAKDGLAENYRQQLEVSNVQLADAQRELDKLKSREASFGDCLNTELRENHGDSYQVELGQDFRPALKHLVDLVRTRYQRELSEAKERIVELEHWFHGYRTPEDSMAAMHDQLTTAKRELADVKAINKRLLDESQEDLESTERLLGELNDQLTLAHAALESLTPGGSEYVGDPEACVAYVRATRSDQFDVIKKFKQERDTVHADNEKLREAIEPVKYILAHAPQTPTESDIFDRGCSLTKAQVRKMQEVLATSHPGSALVERVNAYNELLYAVERKFPNETRHQTALRYIQQAERATDGSGEEAHREPKGCALNVEGE